jgi:hypothetical protein
VIGGCPDSSSCLRVHRSAAFQATPAGAFNAAADEGDGAQADNPARRVELPAAAAEAWREQRIHGLQRFALE